MKNIITVLFFAVSCAAASGQQTYNLTLERSIEIAKEQSYSMQNLEYTYKIAQQNYIVALSNQRTRLDMTGTLPEFREGIRSIEGTNGVRSNFKDKRLTMGSELTLTQPLPTDGRIYLDASYRTVNNYTNESRDGNMGFGIGIDQNIDAIYGFNETRSNIIRAKLNLELATKHYKRTELNLIYSVSSSYYRMLLLQRRMEIAQLDLKRQQEAYEIATNKYEAGLIREVEALQMEVDLASAESSYDEAILNMYEQTNSFKDLVGFNAQDSVVLVSDLSYEIVNIDPELAVKLALENRLEIREQEINIQQQKMNLKQQKAAGLPSTTLKAYFGKAGANNFLLNRPFSDAFSNLYDDMQENQTYSIGLTFAIPIIDWGRNKARVKVSEMSLQQSLLSQDQNEREIESQVRNLISGINSNLRRLKILEKSVIVAEKSFEITIKRFSDGDITSQDLALERNRLNNAYTTHLNAFIDYQLSVTDIMRQTFYDFKAGKPIE